MHAIKEQSRASESQGCLHDSLRTSDVPHPYHCSIPSLNNERMIGFVLVYMQMETIYRWIYVFIPISFYLNRPLGLEQSLNFGCIPGGALFGVMVPAVLLSPHWGMHSPSDNKLFTSWNLVFAFSSPLVCLCFCFVFSNSLDKTFCGSEITFVVRI